MLKQKKKKRSNFFFQFTHDFILTNLIFVLRYSGPGSQLILDKWKIDFNTYMSSGLSYVVLEVDGYGSGGQGEAHETIVKNRLGELEIQDQFTAIR